MEWKLRSKEEALLILCLCLWSPRKGQRARIKTLSTLWGQSTGWLVLLRDENVCYEAGSIRLVKVQLIQLSGISAVGVKNCWADRETGNRWEGNSSYRKQSWWSKSPLPPPAVQTPPTVHWQSLTGSQMTKQKPSFKIPFPFLKVRVEKDRLDVKIWHILPVQFIFWLTLEITVF